MNLAANTTTAQTAAAQTAAAPKVLWGPTSDSHARYFIHLVSGEKVTLSALDQVSMDSSRLYIHTGTRLRRSILLSQVYFCGTSEVPPPGFA